MKFTAEELLGIFQVVQLARAGSESDITPLQIESILEKISIELALRRNGVVQMQDAIRSNRPFRPWCCQEDDPWLEWDDGHGHVRVATGEHKGKCSNISARWFEGQWELMPIDS